MSLHNLARVAGLRGCANAPAETASSLKGRLETGQQDAILPHTPGTIRFVIAGDAAGAEDVFRDGLVQSPNIWRILFGLLESLKAQRKGADLELRLTSHLTSSLA